MPRFLVLLISNFSILMQPHTNSVSLVDVLLGSVSTLHCRTRDEKAWQISFKKPSAKKSSPQIGSVTAVNQMPKKNPFDRH